MVMIFSDLLASLIHIRLILGHLFYIITKSHLKLRKKFSPKVNTNLHQNFSFYSSPRTKYHDRTFFFMERNASSLFFFG